MALTQYEEPTILEIFFDLFFAANYNIFSENENVTDSEHFKAYIGYFWFVDRSCRPMWDTANDHDRLACCG